MICPECYAHARRVRAYSIRTRLLSRFLPYEPFHCEECRWRGLLSISGLRVIPYFNQTMVGWLIGIVIALTIAWLVTGDLEANTFKPTDANTEIKWSW
ncbi:MAG: hypothetical protein HYR56_32235 [Acidobacteria bacterium]|nr:hypothetical protein [Acidobacteriota bacterium]MBI3424639.1 hypothetical protein [Acidobacteriota bacterium]